MYEQYGDEIEFFIVYIREAHAIDSPVPNLQGPLLEDPISFIERASTASRCTEDLHLPMPALVDGMTWSIGATRAILTGYIWSAWMVGSVMQGPGGREALCLTILKRPSRSN